MKQSDLKVTPTLTIGQLELLTNEQCLDALRIALPQRWTTHGSTFLKIDFDEPPVFLELGNMRPGVTYWHTVRMVANMDSMLDDEPDPALAFEILHNTACSLSSMRKRHAFATWRKVATLFDSAVRLNYLGSRAKGRLRDVELTDVSLSTWKPRTAAFIVLMCVGWGGRYPLIRNLPMTPLLELS